MVQATKARTSTAVPAPQDPEVASLKGDGDRAFLNKNYKAAADAYESAVKLMADGLEKAEIQTKAAGAHCLSGRYKEAVRLSTLALDNCGSGPPTSHTALSALKTRAKANEQLGFYTQALNDVHLVNQKSASEETKEQQRRLEAQTGVKQKLNSAPNTRPISAQSSSPSSAQQQPSGNPYSFIVKATLDDETKIVQSSFMMSYNDLYELVRSKFASAGPVVLKFKDKEGDNITLTSTHDWQMAVAETVTQYQKSLNAGAPKLTSLPPMRLTVTKVASEAEVPKEVIPTPAQQAAAKQMAEQPQETYEIDQWLVDFAGLFSELTGIDPGAHHEHINLGSEKLNRILDASLSEEKSVALFDRATEHFKDATCHSIIQWGNTFVVRADRQAQVVLRSGKAIEGKALDVMLKDYDEAEKKYNEALKIKNDSWEAHAAIGQLEWERAKAKIAFIIPSPTIEEAKEEKTPEQVKEETSANLLKALGKIDPKKVGSISKHIDGLNKSYDKGLTFAKQSEEKRKAEEEKAEKEGTAIKKQDLTEEQLQQQKLASPPSHMLIMWGNALYEWSQVLAAINKAEWRSILDTATDKFRAAGAAEADIRAALKNHTKVADLNLGPDPEPKVPAPAAPAAPAAEAEAAKATDAKAAPEAKGLPSLEVKKKPANKA